MSPDIFKETRYHKTIVEYSQPKQQSIENVIQLGMAITSIKMHSDNDLSLCLELISKNISKIFEENM